MYAHRHGWCRACAEPNSSLEANGSGWDAAKLAPSDSRAVTRGELLLFRCAVRPLNALHVPTCCWPHRAAVAGGMVAVSRWSRRYGPRGRALRARGMCKVTRPLRCRSTCEMSLEAVHTWTHPSIRMFEWSHDGFVSDPATWSSAAPAHGLCSAGDGVARRLAWLQAGERKCAGQPDASADRMDGSRCGRPLIESHRPVEGVRH